MAAIEQSIPNMLGGVSQQPDPVKLPGQVRTAHNVLLDPTFGCMKRPPTQWVANLATNLPENAKWFPIFRDNVERYMAVIYRENSELKVKVWDATNGLQRTVNVDPEWDIYADGRRPDFFETLSIADYTLICNTKAITSTNSIEPDFVERSALVTIGQVSYNTTYNIDLGTPDADPVVTTRATKLTISPSAWVDRDESCEFDNAENFQVDDDDGPGVGLSFRITTQGTAQREEDSKDDYECRYTTKVILQNGGTGWRIGDEVEATMSDKTYKIKVEDVEELTTFGNLGIASFTTPINNQDSGGLSLESVTNGLVNSINQIGNFEAETVGNVIKLKRANNKKFTVSVRGGLAGSAMDVIMKTAQDVSKLPTQCFDEYFLRIVNTDDAEADDYYVKFVSDVPGQPGPGNWEETVNINDGESLNPTSMPFALVREADGDFTLGPLDDSSALEGWADRVVGDKNTNPTPSFIGRPIYGMFLHRNRLGFLTEESVVMSQPGDFFNFYATSGVAISDADPVDLSASDTKPVVLRKALATPQGVMLFGEQAQFRLHSEENTFGPNTAELKKISSYDYRSDADPQLTNVSVMFSSSVGEFTKVYELATASLKAESPVFSENTRIVPRFVPTDVQWASACTNNDLVAFGDGKDVYVFRYFNQGDERQVAGWAKWEFDGDIEFMASNGDDIYVIEKIGNRTNLGIMTLVDGPDAPIDVGFTQFRPRVDMQIPSDQLVAGADIKLPSGRVVTPYTLPTGYRGGVNFTGQAAFTDVRTGEYDEIDIVGNTFQVDAERTFIFGRKYESVVELPSFYVKTDNRADRISNVMVQQVYVDLFNSGAVQAVIKVQGYDDREIVLPLIESDAYAASSVVVEENYTSDMPIYQLGSQTYITLTSETPFPTSFTSYSWSGQYNKRGYQRI